MDGVGESLPSIDKKSLFGRRGHMPAGTGVKERSHGKTVS